jgi:polyferredoxin
MYRRMVTRYGADPLHLLVLLACFALAGYAASRVIVAGIWLGFLVWFVGAAIIHDLILYPLYALADVVARSRPWHRLRPPRRAVQWPPAHNYVRVPVALSGLLLLVWFPLIFRLSEDTYRASTGLDLSPYLGRWLLVTGVLFAGSALAYALRVRRRAAWRERVASRRERAASRRERATPPKE